MCKHLPVSLCMPIHNIHDLYMDLTKMCFSILLSWICRQVCSGAPDTSWKFRRLNYLEKWLIKTCWGIPIVTVSLHCFMLTWQSLIPLLSFENKLLAVACLYIISCLLWFAGHSSGTPGDSSRSSRAAPSPGKRERERTSEVTSCLFLVNVNHNPISSLLSFALYSSLVQQHKCILFTCKHVTYAGNAMLKNSVLQLLINPSL